MRALLLLCVALCLALCIVAVGAAAGCALPPGSGGAVEGGLLTGGASVRWEPPPANAAPAPDWRRWNDCIRSQHAMRDGDACRCVVAYRALGDLAEFAHCHARIPRGADRAVDAAAPRHSGPPGGRGADPAGPPDLAALKRLLRADEGWSDGADGHVGYGHRLPLGREDAEALLDVAARRALADAEAALASPEAWAALAPERRLALGSMAYQMGRAGLAGFQDMLAAVRERRWRDAADGMLDSKWAREDSPARAQRLAATMRSGK